MLEISEVKEKFGLTSREIDVVYLVVTGMNNREIASKLYVSIHTIKAVLENIYAKLGVYNRVQLTVWAFRNKVVE